MSGARHDSLSKVFDTDEDDLVDLDQQYPPRGSDSNREPAGFYVTEYQPSPPPRPSILLTLQAILLFLQEKFREFTNISQDKMQSEGFFGKYIHTFLVLSGVREVRTEPSKWGVLDIFCLGIPRILFAGSEALSAISEKEPAQATVAAVIFWILRQFLAILLAIPFGLQMIAGALLTFVFAFVIPIIPFMHWLYPEEKAGVDIEDEYFTKAEKMTANRDKGENNRRLFRNFIFNPSTGMFFFALSAGISLLIQTFNPGLFLAEAAVPLFIMQTVFVSIAGLMLVGAVLSLAYYGIEKLLHNPRDEYDEITETEIIPGRPKPQSAVVNYLSAFKAWCGKRPEIAIPVIVFGAAGVLTLLVLTIGFFTGGFGLSPEAFSFMGPVFDFIGSGFTSGIQGASALPGLGALGSMSEVTMQLIGQVAAVFTLFAAAIFVPDTLRRVLQTRWPEKAAPVYERIEGGDQPQEGQPEFLPTHVALMQINIDKVTIYETFAEAGEALAFVRKNNTYSDCYIMRNKQGQECDVVHGPQVGLIVTIMSDFDGKSDDDELSVVTGEKFYVMTGSNWLQVSSLQDKERIGWIPIDCTNYKDLQAQLAPQSQRVQQPAQFGSFYQNPTPTSNPGYQPASFTPPPPQ